MTEPKPLNQFGQYIRNQLLTVKQTSVTDDSAQRINVAGVGYVVSAAYEQLRNAAEYTQEHLLRQKAIRRFYTRNLQFYARHTPARTVAEELIVELTQAGYVDNDTLPVEVVDKIHDTIWRHYDTFWQMKTHGVPRDMARDWTLQLLSVESESFIDAAPKQALYARLAFHHYQATLSKDLFLRESGDEVADYEPCLYVAVHRSLLKSDIANVRYDMLQLYNLNAENLAAYIAFHRNIDRIFVAPLADRITRHIVKYGAPLRILRSMINDSNAIDDVMLDRRRFLAAYETQIGHEYEAARRKVNRGILKSIAFLIITKMLVGLAVEIPYDLWVIGHIAFVPLLINLFSPIVYMLLLGFGLKLPGETNTRAIREYIDAMLYGGSDQASLYTPPRRSGYSKGFTFVYVALIVVVFGGIIAGLKALDFNVVQGAIFFVFLGTASFLGFRLSRIIRELELVVTKQSFIISIRDFIYMPFILLGQWLSEKYAKVNFVALILDTMIELPLKTILRLVRQWTSFIGDKKDEI